MKLFWRRFRHGGSCRKICCRRFMRCIRMRRKRRIIWNGIVHSLAPEYAADTVRTAILKKFLAGAGTDFKRFRTANFLAWGKKRLTKTEAEQFPALSASEQQRLILSKIDDSVFEQKTAALSGCDILRLIAGRIVRYREDETLSFDHLEISPETERQLKGFLARYGLKGEDSPAEGADCRDHAGAGNRTLSGGGNGTADFRTGGQPGNRLQESAETNSPRVKKPERREMRRNCTNRRKRTP